MNKKNIDELFKERFRDFDGVPDEKVWKAIEASLEKKKSRKVIPIWWKLGGVAAVLTILFFAINPFQKSDEIEVSDIKKQDQIEQKKTFDTLKKDSDNNSTHSESGIAEKELKNSTKTDENHQSKEAYAKTNTKENSENDIVNKKQVKGQAIFKTSVDEVAENQSKSEKIKGSNINLTNEHKANRTPLNHQIESQETLAKTNEINNIEKNTRADNEENKSNILKNLITSKDKEETAIVKEEEKKSIFEEIENQNKEIAENKKEKWSVGPSIAPVYFNGIGEGSPVHTIFVPNSKSGNMNLSYGVSVAYEVSKKLKVRSGVHKVDYGYTTNQVEFSATAVEFKNPQIQNIDYSASAQGIIVSSKFRDYNSADSPIENAFDVTAKSPALEGNLSQQFGYLEVPLELNYALVDKRFGINIIGGVSSLFLVNNNIFLNSGNQTTEMGEANNINDINFSTNVGFGLNYQFSPKLQFNVEPIFKYQLNTFSNTAGNFQPFSIGVYSGFSLRF